MSISLFSYWIPVGIGAFAGLFMVIGVLVWKRHRWLSVMPAVGALLTIPVMFLALKNDYYQYIPTVGNLFGHYADAASAKSVRTALGPTGTAAQQSLPNHGQVIEMQIPGTQSGFKARDAEVYLPPRWFVPGTNPLPVIELLQGTPGQPQDWVRGGGVQETSDDWAAQNNGYAPIVVMPDPNGSVFQDTECVDGKRGNAETYLTTDVRNFAVTQLRASAQRQNWAIGGLSEGGYCGAMLTLKHPDLYSIFLDFGGEAGATVSGGNSALFAGTPQQIRAKTDSYSLPTLIAQHNSGSPEINGWFIAGADDVEVNQSNARLNTQANAHDLHTHLLTIPNGRHTFNVWKTSLADAYPDTATRLGANG